MRILVTTLTVAVVALASLTPGTAWSTLSHPARTNAIASKPGFSATTLFSASAADLFVDNISKYKAKELVAASGDADDAEDTKPLRISIPTVASVVVATVGTFVLNNYMSIGPIGASSVAALIAAFYLPEKLAPAAFCGSFAGMAKLAVIPGVFSSTILGLICAAMLTVFDNKKWLVGVGGRLGFIAQCACTLQFFVSAPHLFFAPDGPAALIGSAPKFVTLAAELPTVASFTMAGALFVRYWREAFAGVNKSLANAQECSFSFLGQLMMRFSLRASQRLSTPVGAVGATGLLASLLLPASLASPVFCGTFVAMSASARLPNVNSLVPACLLAGIAQQSLAGVMLGGWAGKMGTAALMGVLASNLFQDKIDDILDDLKPDDIEELLPEETMMQAAETTLEQPPKQPRHVYTYKAPNQSPVVQKPRPVQENAAATDGRKMEMSVLMAVEGKLEYPSSASKLDEKKPMISAPKAKPGPKTSFKIKESHIPVKDKKESPTATVGAVGRFPVRALQADSPVFATEGNSREYKVPRVLPVQREVLPRQVEIGPLKEKSTNAGDAYTI